MDGWSLSLAQELPSIPIGEIKEPEDCFKMIFCSAATGRSVTQLSAASNVKEQQA
jgi:hypothetical protein